jgi:hypothetical protein
MRTIATSLFVLGCMFLSNAQVTNDSESMIELEDVLVTTINSDYLESVQDKETPKVVASLQRRAAGYNVHNSSAFDKKQSRDFEMLFANSHGKINAFYDGNGKITSTIESFKNVPLPISVRQEIQRSNANWEMVENSYNGAYNDNKLIKRNYKVLLKKGDATKRIVINALK